MQAKPSPDNPYRTLTEDDITDAKALVGWQFWMAPVLSTAGYLLGAWLVMDLGWTGEIICFVMLGGVAIYAWVNRLGQHRKLADDISKRLVSIVEGAPERIFMKYGLCYVRISGRKIRVANEYFNELRDANNVRIEFLPESLLAIRVQIMRGIGI